MQIRMLLITNELIVHSENSEIILQGCIESL